MGAPAVRRDGVPGLMHGGLHPQAGDDRLPATPSTASLADHREEIRVLA
jgi:hypothetical protein